MTNLYAKKAVLANLMMSSWGVRRFDEEAAAEVLASRGAEREQGLFTKRLINKAEMKDIRSIKHAARAYHHRTTRVWLDDGTRMLPTLTYLEYSKQMAQYKKDFEEAVAKFVKNYPKALERAKKELGKLFNADDYPTQQMVARKFSFDVIIMPCPDKDDFRINLDADDMAEIKEDLEKRIKEQMEASLKEVGERIAEVVGHMAETLKEYKPANKAKGIKATNTFRDSLVGNVQKLADLIPALNIEGNGKLNDIHKSLAKLTKNDAEALRDDDVIRKQVMASASQILKDVSAFMS